MQSSRRSCPRDRKRGEPAARCKTKADVLCQALRRLAGRAAGLADGGLLSSAARSALRAALRVTAAPAIRWVAARSGTGPDGVGMVTVTWRCSARWRAGSYGMRSCQHCHTMRHQARPTVRIARGWSWPRARAGGVEVLRPGVPVAGAVGERAERDAQALVAAPAEAGGLAFAGLDRDRGLAGVAGERVAGGVAGAAVADLGEQLRGGDHGAFEQREEDRRRRDARGSRWRSGARAP